MQDVLVTDTVDLVVDGIVVGITCKYSNGTVRTFDLHGVICSFDDKPSRVEKRGQFWHKDGRLHREGKPACIYENGFVAWRNNGLLHRIDGPAIERLSDVNEWWVDGTRYDTRASYQQAAGLSDGDMAALVLQYGDVC